MRKNYSKQTAHLGRERSIKSIERYPEEYLSTLVELHTKGCSYPKVIYVLSNLFPEAKPPSYYVYNSILNAKLGQKINVRRRAEYMRGGGFSNITFSADAEVVEWLNSLPETAILTDVINSILLLYIHRYKYDEAQREKGRLIPHTYDRFGREVPVGSIKDEHETHLQIQNNEQQ